ncbi:MAG: hypothetical protein B7X04_01785 [Parcubacteria group bacterium 21-54-25]|nr:MAG: hypothetical protein B7X04_01785 [Parcubacteria group bacterium 21-54-25]HQU07693.1 phosphoribosyltransferase family protein [Candidatus Paceibacterota bacterium]
MRIAEWLVDLLFPPRASEQRMRRGDTNAVLALLSPTVIDTCTPPAIGLLPFRDPLVRALIHEAKYHEHERAFALLGGALHEYLAEWTADVGFGDVCVVPVPLSAARQKTRGYNQVERVLAYAMRGVSITVHSDLLVRLRDTPSQTTLSGSARQENVHGAFGAVHPLSPESTYILLDDVLTTGATMQAAIDALTQAGAARIIPIALAH